MLGPLHILYLACNYLIFILVLVLEAIGLGFTHCHPSWNIKIFMDINSWDPIHLPIITKLLFLLFTFNFHFFHSPLLFLLLLTTGIQPISRSFTYFTPISPFLIFTSTEPQSSSLVSPCTSSYSSSSLAMDADFHSIGGSYRVDHALMCTTWYTKCRESFSNVCWWIFLMSLFPRRGHLPPFFSFLFFLRDYTFSDCLAVQTASPRVSPYLLFCTQCEYFILSMAWSWEYSH